MTPQFLHTLEYLLAHAPEGREDWWLIGSGALAVMGLKVEARDVDLLSTHEGGWAWLEAFQTQAMPKSGDGLFRSQIFKSLEVERGLDLEIMGHLEVKGPQGWQTLIPRTRRGISTPAGMVYVPEPEEMLDILMLFGRPKDMDRAALLREAMSLL